MWINYIIYETTTVVMFGERDKMKKVVLAMSCIAMVCMGGTVSKSSTVNAETTYTVTKSANVDNGSSASKGDKVKTHASDEYKTKKLKKKHQKVCKKTKVSSEEKAKIKKDKSKRKNGGKKNKPSTPQQNHGVVAK